VNVVLRIEQFTRSRDSFCVAFPQVRELESVQVLGDSLDETGFRLGLDATDTPGLRRGRAGAKHGCRSECRRSQGGARGLPCAVCARTGRTIFRRGPIRPRIRAGSTHSLPTSMAMRQPSATSPEFLIRVLRRTGG
jgi:hypothetical protein